MTLPREDDPRPPYIQAAAALRREIATGRLKEGEQLPSARTLQDQYGLASSTVQNALRVLKTEELIYTVQGRGSFVRQGAMGLAKAQEANQFALAYYSPLRRHAEEELPAAATEGEDTTSALDSTLDAAHAIMQIVTVLQERLDDMDVRVTRLERKAGD